MGWKKDVQPLGVLKPLMPEFLTQRDQISLICVEPKPKTLREECSQRWNQYLAHKTSNILSQAEPWESRGQCIVVICSNILMLNFWCETLRASVEEQMREAIRVVQKILKTGRQECRLERLVRTRNETSRIRFNWVRIQIDPVKIGFEEVNLKFPIKKISFNLSLVLISTRQQVLLFAFWHTWSKPCSLQICKTWKNRKKNETFSRFSFFVWSLLAMFFLIVLLSPELQLETGLYDWKVDERPNTQPGWHGWDVWITFGRNRSSPSGKGHKRIEGTVVATFLVQKDVH